MGLLKRKVSAVFWAWLTAAPVVFAGVSYPASAQPDGPQPYPQPKWQSNQWQTIELDFVGPQTSETDENNPFTDMRLHVRFAGPDGTFIRVRGFYAADGNAAETSAQSGAVWRVRFLPDQIGTWSYRADMRHGPNVALSDTDTDGEPVPLAHHRGVIQVVAPAEGAVGTARHGPVIHKAHNFAHADGTLWLKGGANSPENLLGYADFDGTYRISASAREGESAVDEALHTFAPHVRDWRAGDPVWQRGGGTGAGKGAGKGAGTGRGKGLIGAVNYLADQGMNAAYFLTLNVDGDGRDVWPWRDPSDPTRFDVSKLAQWERVFAHMQKRGIALHVVLQETENELLLDGGDTGRLRQLYLHELIARFGHHPLLFWNLGEENGPVHWRPEGQDDAQRKAMIDFFVKHDPYRHPVLLHTHSEAADKDTILSPLLGYPGLSGLSFQVADRTTVNAQIRKWHALSRDAGQPWVITMDEIGQWQVGARADADDPLHDSLRRHALWGTFLAGGAGVEWYFGAHQRGNDLTTEDWRSRENLWRQTRIALEFFRTEVPFAGMKACGGQAYCLTKDKSVYAIYISSDTPALRPGDVMPGRYELRWFDPLKGKFETERSVVLVREQGLPNALEQSNPAGDRVAVLRRVEVE